MKTGWKHNGNALELKRRRKAKKISKQQWHTHTQKCFYIGFRKIKIDVKEKHQNNWKLKRRKKLNGKNKQTNYATAIIKLKSPDKKN